MSLQSEFDVRSASVSGLLRSYRAILDELMRRDVTRTLNAPTGDLAELLVAISVNGELAPNSEKSYDVMAEDGRRIQVKSRILTRGRRGERQLSTFRSWDFTHLGVVLFGPDYSIVRGAMIPNELVREAATEDRHVGGNRVMATDELLSSPGVDDITEFLVASFEQLDVDRV